MFFPFGNFLFIYPDPIIFNPGFNEFQLVMANSLMICTCNEKRGLLDSIVSVLLLMVMTAIKARGGL